MKIQQYTDNYILFSDGSKITASHIQDCCEMNWADFSVLEIFYAGEEFETYFIDVVDGAGFLLCLMMEHNYANRVKKILIPCYSDQNGYYSSSITITIETDQGITSRSFNAEERIH